MHQRCVGSARARSPSQKANPFDGQQQATAGFQHRPATLVEGKRLPLLSFFSRLLALGLVTDTKCGPSTVDLADTHAKSKTLVEQRLDHGTRYLGRCPASVFQKSSSCSTKLAGMTMSSVLQRRFTPLLHRLVQSVRR
jgi:hypothetical protein